MREERTEVLVVGAGPVGLWTALLLAERGAETTIIDRENRTTTRSYACALHPGTLKRLARFGLGPALLDRGRKIAKVGLFDPRRRQAELRISDPDHPYLLTLPQSALESALEDRLRSAGVKVEWNHRFDSFEPQPDELEVTVEELGGTSTGYIIPHWETVVKDRYPVRTQYLIGADGHNSLVRQRAGVQYRRIAGPEFFAAYEFQSDDPGEDELRVVFDQATTNVLWPLPNGGFRWTFQMQHTEIPDEFPEKERRTMRVSRPNVDERIRQYVQKVAKQRAPWFSGAVKEVTWCTQVAFEHGVAAQAGKGRCWLVGDAAHQTGPAGVQSMNAGFAEAENLAEAIARIIRENGEPGLLGAGTSELRSRWDKLLGLGGGLQARSDTPEWISGQKSRILPCLPGTGTDLATYAGQLRCDWV